jgi:hypothetical protein
MRVVSGFGFKTVADGGGRRVVAATNGTAGQASIRQFRHILHIVGGGHFRARQTAAAHRLHRRLTTVGAASTGTFTFCLKSIAKNDTVNVTLPEKKPSETASLVGVASTEKSSRRPGPIAKRDEASVSIHLTKPSAAAVRVGAA